MLSPELMSRLDLLLEEDLPEEELEECDLPTYSDPIDCGPEKAQISSPARSAGSSMMSDIIRENIKLKKQLDADHRIADFSRKVFSPIAFGVHVFSIAGLLCWSAFMLKGLCVIADLMMLILNIIY